ncbi:MAG: HAMP domain-containing sensor histidine kinase [Pirellula sp.]
MKKPSRDKGQSNIRSENGRGNRNSRTRPPRRTVHTIAPVETPSIIPLNHGPQANGTQTQQENGRPSDRTLEINADQANEFAFHLLELALQHQSFSVAQLPTTNIDTDLAEVLNHLRQSAGIAMPLGSTTIRLRWLLHQTVRGKIKICHAQDQGLDRTTVQRFKLAIQRALSALSLRKQFSSAVEDSSRQAIYQLAYGLSHEINNPLANIAARAQQLMTQSPESDRKSLATIVDQAMRAHEMLAEMMRVVQPRSVSLRTEDVVATLQQVAERFRSECERKNLRLELSLSAKPLFAAVDRASLGEAMTSLIQNAVQVCRPTDQIELLCESVERDRAQIGQQECMLLNSPNGELENTPSWIRIAIRDTGPGMSPEIAANAWSLYFSGREHGRGLGISLANVKRIVDAHCGIVWIDSTVNAGCTVEIRLPRSADPAPARRSFSI